MYRRLSQNYSIITNIYPRVLSPTGKKGKKNKGKTIALTEFLQEKSGTIASLPIRKSTTNWADEVEEYGKSCILFSHNVHLTQNSIHDEKLDSVELDL